MGMLSDFFVASPNELHAVLPGWLPAADQPTTREAVNPFTGKKQHFRYWPPAVEPPQTVTPESQVPNYQHVSRIEWGKVDQEMLARLNVILSGGELPDKREQFERPALVDPRGSGGAGLHRFDEGFVAALAAMTELETTARDWAATAEMQRRDTSEDVCQELLCDLQKLAQEAQASGKSLYYWWCS